MELTNPQDLLQRALRADAIGSAASVVALVAFARPLAALLEVPAELLLAVGALLVPFAALAAAAAWPPQPRRALAWAVIGLNGAWLAASAWLPLSGRIAPNALGVAVIALQALAVAGIAELEWFALRRAERVTSPAR